jgi:hypothetical protein
MSETLYHIGSLYESIICEKRCLNYNTFSESIGDMKKSLKTKKNVINSISKNDNVFDLDDVIERVRVGDPVKGTNIEINELGLYAKIPLLSISTKSEKAQVTSFKYLAKPYLAAQIEINTLAVMVRKKLKKEKILPRNIQMSIRTLKPLKPNQNSIIYQKILEYQIDSRRIAPYIDRLYEIKSGDVKLSPPRAKCDNCWALSACGGYDTID